MADKAERMANDPYFKIDHEGPRVLVSLVWMSLRHFPCFFNVIVHTGMPRTNKELDFIKMAAANWIMETSGYEYSDEVGNELLDRVFIIDLKEV